MADPIKSLSIAKGTTAVSGYDEGVFKWGWIGRPHLDAFMSVKVGTTGYDFGNIIVEAMIRVGDVIEDHSLYDAIADRLENHKINGRHITPQGFEPKDVERLFKKQKLKHTRYRIGSTGGDRWGEAHIGDNWLSLNAASITHTILSAFGDNPNPVADVTAGVIIHEMMHCDGFEHSLRPGDYIYECSLPEIAQDAYLHLKDSSGGYGPYGMIDPGKSGGFPASRCGLDEL